MYKKGAVLLMLGQLMIIVCLFVLSDEVKTEPVYKKSSIHMESMVHSASARRVLEVSEIHKDVPEVSKEDYENLLRIVEAEAGGEDATGKLLVANVVLNRVKNEAFPDTVTEVIFQKENGVCQFSPIGDGRFYEVKVSDDTIEAVERALNGEDVSQGALYFVARNHANPEYMNWFDSKLTKLFAHGGHEFYL